MSQVLSIDHPECVARAVHALRQGGILCVPTETVYGFICPALTSSMERLSSIKRRPANKPFALFVSSWERIQREAIDPCPTAERLGHRLWPGPLTLVIPARDPCPGVYRGSVGVRCPDYPLVQEILRECGGLLINTSVNRSGEAEYRSLTNPDDFLQQADLLIDGGTLPERLPSTVVDCRIHPPKILREGEIGAETISQCLDEVSS